MDFRCRPIHMQILGVCSIVLTLFIYNDVIRNGVLVGNKQPEIKSEITSHTHKNDGIDEIKRYTQQLPGYHYINTSKNPCYLEEYSDRQPSIVTNPHKSKPVLIKTGHEKVSRLRCFPYFHVIGVGKSGTTDFYDRLKAHPKVFGPFGKEPHYFDMRRFSKNATLTDYSEMFDKSAAKIARGLQYSHGKIKDGNNDFILGDFTPTTYIGTADELKLARNDGNTDPGFMTPDIIHSLTPAARLILIVRNPTERVLSEYRYFRDKSSEEFHIQASYCINWWQRCVSNHSEKTCAYNRPKDMPRFDVHIHHLYQTKCRRGLYAVYLQHWLDVFPRENLLVIRFEDYIKNGTEYISRVVTKFLQIGPYPENVLKKLSTKPKSNPTKGRGGDPKTHPITMLDKTKVMLDNFYAPFNKRLADLLGDTRYTWT